MLRLSTLKQEGTYQAAKWLKVQALVTREELSALFAVWRPFSLHPLTGIVEVAEVNPEKFLDAYGEWILALQGGQVPTAPSLRKWLAIAATATEDALWLQQVGEGRFLVKIREPVVQIQAHHFAISGGEVRPGVMGSHTIFWGLQFSFPTVYQSQATGDLIQVDEAFPNMRLWAAMRQWVRDWTRPTPFMIDGKRVMSPIRIGNGWLGGHPQLPGWTC